MNFLSVSGEDVQNFELLPNKIQGREYIGSMSGKPQSPVSQMGTDNVCGLGW